MEAEWELRQDKVFVKKNVRFHYIVRGKEKEELLFVFP